MLPHSLPTHANIAHVDLRGTIQLVPPQQQLENNPNQKSKNPHKHGWDGTTLATPILIKNKNKAKETKK
jgi:hypothetical protein